MMQKLLERGTKVTGVEQILISVTSTQAAAVNLYRSLGFEPFGREPRALRVGGRFIDEEYLAMTPGTDAQK
jgi:ribosomal protein S18 acetylase RimI-like enzyme